MACMVRLTETTRNITFMLYILEDEKVHENYNQTTNPQLVMLLQ